MLRYILIFFILIFANKVEASNKEKIIKNLENIKNFSFKFEQNINNKIEKGRCTIQYSKKIYCEYQGNRKKKLISDGKLLVIKTNNSGLYYKYPLKKTPLNLILDKKFLINAIKKLNSKIIDENYINYTFEESGNKVNVFFDKNNYNLVGWQTLDIYQNLNITFISSLTINQKINEDLFLLPE